jgi:hypothetical protein
MSDDRRGSWAAVKNGGEGRDPPPKSGLRPAPLPYSGEGAGDWIGRVGYGGWKNRL